MKFQRLAPLLYSSIVKLGIIFQTQKMVNRKNNYIYSFSAIVLITPGVNHNRPFVILCLRNKNTFEHYFSILNMVYCFLRKALEVDDGIP